MMTSLVCASLLSLAMLAPGGPEPEPPGKVEIRRAETSPAEGLTEAAVGGTAAKVYPHRAAGLTNKDVAEARAGKDAGKRPAIELVFTMDGAKKMEGLSGGHLGKPLAFLVGGKVSAAPVVRARISGRATITGDFTEEQVAAIVKAINGK
jgi:preprotein translocase subunit SecD